MTSARGRGWLVDGAASGRAARQAGRCSGHRGLGGALVAGEILILSAAGRDASPQKRNVGFVFPALAAFERTSTVHDNIAFGSRWQAAKARIRRPRRTVAEARPARGVRTGTRRSSQGGSASGMAPRTGGSPVRGRACSFLDEPSRRSRRAARVRAELRECRAGFADEMPTSSTISSRTTGRAMAGTVATSQIAGHEPRFWIEQVWSPLGPRPPRRVRPLSPWLSRPANSSSGPSWVASGTSTIAHSPRIGDAVEGPGRPDHDATASTHARADGGGRQTSSPCGWTRELSTSSRSASGRSSVRAESRRARLPCRRGRFAGDLVPSRRRRPPGRARPAGALHQVCQRRPLEDGAHGGPGRLQPRVAERHCRAAVTRRRRSKPARCAIGPPRPRHHAGD